MRFRGTEQILEPLAMSSHDAARSAKRWRRSGMTALAAAAVLAIGLSGLPAEAASSGEVPAEEGSSSESSTSARTPAASKGTGFGEWAPISAYGWHGSMRVGNTHTYCIEPGEPVPTGTTSDRGITGNVSGLTAKELTGINLLVSKYGQTSDPVKAAAVSWAVKAVVNWSETISAYGYQGNSLAGAINWTFYSLSPENNQQIQNLAVAYYTEAINVTPGVLSGSGPLDFKVDTRNNYEGAVTAKLPASANGSTGTLQLTNGVFVDTGNKTLAGAKPGTAYKVRGVPPTDNGAPYKISGTGTFTGTGHAAAVRLFTTPGQQSTAGPGGTPEFTAAGADPMLRVSAFAPVATSAAPRFAKPGDSLTDTATFSLVADKNGRVNEWFRNSKGEYAPTVWTVEAYEVTKAPTETTAALPEDAKLLASTTVNTGTRGPKQATANFGDAVMPANGNAVVYRWVFRTADQPASIKPLFIDGYEWADQFGLVEETTFAPAATSTAQVVSKPGESSSDIAHVTGVLPVEGLELVFEKYQAPVKQLDDGSWAVDGPEGFDPHTAAPEDWEWARTDDNLIGTDSQVITEAGDYESEQLATTDTGGLELWVHSLWTVPADGGERELVSRSQIGDPTERTAVLKVTTKAQSTSDSSVLDQTEPIWDIAQAWGWIPEGSTVTFEAYRVPFGDEFVCTDDTRIWTSDPIHAQGGFYTVTDPLEVDSGSFTPSLVTYKSSVTFVETTRDAEGRLLSQGECGDPAETVHYAATPPSPPSLTRTGMEGVQTAALGTAGVLLLAGAVVLIVRRRRAANVVATRVD